MKKKITLSHRIFLINKKYKKKEFFHYIKEPNNSLIIPVLNKKYFVLVIQKREPINKKNYEFPMGWIDKNELPIRAASRELLEETDHSGHLSSIEKIGAYLVQLTNIDLIRTNSTKIIPAVQQERPWIYI